MSDKKITDLPSGSALSGTELIEIAQSGGSFKIPIADIGTFIGIYFVPNTGATNPVDLGSETLTVGGIVTIGAAPNTTQRALRVGEGTTYIDFGEANVGGAVSAIWLGATALRTNTNYNLAGDINDVVLNGAASVQIRIVNVRILNINSTGVQVSGDISISGKPGFYGATPPVQQSGGAATAGALYTSNEQTMLQKLYDMARNTGLIS